MIIPFIDFLRFPGLLCNLWFLMPSRKLKGLKMGLWCLLFGHAQGCECSRCGESKNQNHDWDGCECRICGKIEHNWVVKNWTFDGQKYTFEKVCSKCKEEIIAEEIVPFGKILLGRQAMFS
jgi:hypothetical protein